jgi:hypothetical protein
MRLGTMFKFGILKSGIVLAIFFIVQPLAASSFQAELDGYYQSRYYQPIDYAHNQAILKTDREIRANNLANGLLVMFNRTDLYVRGLVDALYFENGEQTLQTIRDVHILQLCYGLTLFARDDSERYETKDKFIPISDTLIYFLSKISHKDTTEILGLLRGFIPPFSKEDYCDAPEQPKHGWLNYPENISLPYIEGEPFIEVENDTLGCIKLPIKDYGARDYVFADFVRALAAYSSKEQLFRLSRLVQVLDIKHLSPVLHADPTLTGFNTQYNIGRFGFTECFRGSLAFISDRTTNMTTEDYKTFIAYLKKRDPGFNPLFVSSEERFQDILDDYISLTNIRPKIGIL